jgi:hypothetical protein
MPAILRDKKASELHACNDYMKSKKLRARSINLDVDLSDGGRCKPGSIEQQLDMCEEGDLRGDEILHSHGSESKKRGKTIEKKPLDRLMDEFSADLSEPAREGDEMSGDEHSSGLQGDAPDPAEQDSKRSA